MGLESIDEKLLFEFVSETLDPLNRPEEQFAGSAIIGDGLVGLILDAEGIINSG